MRSPLIVTSVGLHIVVVAAFFITGIWKLERLEGERRRVDIAVAPPPPPAPSGSPAAAPAEPFKKKQRTMTKAIVLPEKPDPETKPANSAPEPGLGTGGTGSGAGSGSGTDPIGTGTCIGDGCGKPDPTPPIEPPKKTEPVIVPPTIMKGLRTSGETQIHPPAPVKTAILRDGKTKVTAAFRVCVGTDGEIASATVIKSSGYAGYDSALDDGLRRWRYRAYEIGGRKVPVCGIVTFIYAMQ